MLSTRHFYHRRTADRWHLRVPLLRQRWLRVSRPQPDVTVTTSSANTYTITRNLATVAARADITASWMVTPARGNPLTGSAWSSLAMPQNFIATDGEGNTAWTYTNAVDTGTFTIAAPLIAGTYEFLYCVNNGFTCPARSPTFTVTTSSGTYGQDLLGHCQLWWY